MENGRTAGTTLNETTEISHNEVRILFSLYRMSKVLEIAICVTRLSAALLPERYSYLLEVKGLLRVLLLKVTMSLSTRVTYNICRGKHINNRN